MSVKKKAIFQMLSKLKTQRNITMCISYGALGTKEKKHQQKQK